MAHELTQSDTVVTVNTQAWHGLAKVITEAKTPEEMVRLANLTWEVEQWPLTRTNGTERHTVETHVCNVRSDNHEQLGVVGAGWKPMQNLQLANLCSSLAQGGDVVRCETAGSIRGGKRVWIEMRGQSFSVGPKDIVDNYLLAAMGHDGMLAIWFQPTSTRVVCSNTLHYALDSKVKFNVRLQYSGDMSIKAEDVKKALGLYRQCTEEFAGQTNALAERRMTKTEVDLFVMEAIAGMLDVKEIPTSKEALADKKAKAKRDKAVEIYRQIAANFDADRAKTGSASNLWTAFNATTQYLQHQKPVRAANDAARVENRVYSDIFGGIGETKTKLFSKALAMVS